MGKRGTTPKTLKTLAPGVSLRQLSKRTGVQLSHLSRVVNGKRGLTVRVAVLIAKATGQSLERVVTALSHAA